MNILRKPFPYKYFRATLILIVVNVAVFGLLYLLRDMGINGVFAFNVDGQVVHYSKRMPINHVLGVSVPKTMGWLLPNEHVITVFWWTPFTYMFVHGNFWHLFSNMLGLFFFGTAVERRLGSWEFLFIYLLSGILDGIFSMAMYSAFGVNVLLIGASGAVYAILFLFAVLYPRDRIFIWGIIPVPAPLLVAIYVVMEVVGQLFGRGGVAHLTHLIGFALALVYCFVRLGVNPFKIWRMAWRR